MLKFIIIDDEPLAHEIIEEFCAMMPHLELVGNCYSAMEAMQFLSKSQVDFMFLDINMPKLSGLDFIRTLPNSPEVIITSAYKEYALDGYELGVVDYLLKPIPFDRLVKAINKLGKKQQSSVLIQDEGFPVNGSIFVKSDKKHHQIKLTNMLFIEAYGNYTKLYVKDEMIVSHEKIAFYEEQFKNRGFLRVHKSFIVAIEKINQIEGNRIKIQEHQIPIGQTYKSVVNKLITK